MSGVAIGGFMGAGKSAVGRALARRLSWPLVDMDDVLTERFGPIRVQFARDGEAAFRAREAALVQELCDGQTRVLATGGGVFVYHLDALTPWYRTVTLDAPFDLLESRVETGRDRPLWDERIAERFRDRRAAYLRADWVLDVGDAGVEELAERIERWLRG